MGGDEVEVRNASEASQGIHVDFNAYNTVQFSSRN